ncbi:MAG TPA: MOSC N-terminal beta barrel domain-containing protein [Gaiellaceae bacterium]|nr:MOSC N-terminal beta barrel domain-containing protein [Gaiellaceae bacterium]
MHVAELWRYPVKSMRGERLESVRVGVDGVEGDRVVHVRQEDGRVITSRFRPGLLGLSATLGVDGPLIDGLPWDSPEALERVRRASSAKAELVAFDGHDRGQRYDVLPLTVLTDGMARAVGVDHRRFRPNILIGGVEELAETDWPGRSLRIGELVIGVRNRRSRCVMTTFDPDTLEQDAGVLRQLVREFDGQVALDCWVEQPGRVAVGDAVELEPA